MFKVNNNDTRTTPMAPYFTPCSSVSIANFEHIIAGWVNGHSDVLKARY